MSKCVPLEENKTYEFNMAYLAQTVPNYGIYTSFDVLIGKSGTTVETFKTLAQYDNVGKMIIDLTDLDTTSFEFSVESSGDYVFSILPIEFASDEVGGSYLGIGYINIDEKNNIGVELPVKAVNTLRVYPVPAYNILNVEDVRNGGVSVVDMTGRTVMQRTVGNSARLSLDIRALPDGVYILRSGGLAVRFVKF
jgi:hypothetical protein